MVIAAVGVVAANADAAAAPSAVDDDASISVGVFIDIGNMYVINLAAAPADASMNANTGSWQKRWRTTQREKLRG